MYGLEQSGGRHFLVMELVEGDTLSQRIPRGPIPVEEALRIGCQIAEALKAAHDKGVIHRDLKPANVKITLEGKVKVLDFGLAKASETQPETFPRLSALSETGEDAAPRPQMIITLNWFEELKQRVPK